MGNMNKYLGLLELKSLPLPCVEWEEFKTDSHFDKGCLWAVRVANLNGVDISLPCRLGITSKEVTEYASKLSLQYDLVIVSEYFFAKISGVLLVDFDNFVIEWTYGDSHRLTRHGFVEETIYVHFSNLTTGKNKLDESTTKKLYQYAHSIRYLYRDDLLSSKSVVLEWSLTAPTEAKSFNRGYHYSADQLVFYDFRIV